ncbi:MAG TPA: efflux RND transporter periplasmic adaptor subunit [Tepidisphaeraceae bacterium]|jgi:multidrug efflux system membrane fusion protein|nr:efflux RND transporter periplasmic adaptor subunit [Tepidisphaeraceae bacterium]
MTPENTHHHPGPSPIPPDHQLPSPQSRTHPAIKLGIIVVILLIAAGVAVVILHRRGPVQTNARAGRHGAGGPVAITTAVAKTGNIGVYLPAIGTVTPVYTASITSQVNGTITDVHYTEGQLVKKGDRLIDIDDRPYQATLLQAQGALQRDQALLAQAKMDLDRYQKAWDRDKAIAEQQLEDQKKLVDQYNGTVQNDLGAVHYDQIQVQFCHIISPIDGRAGLRLVDPGNVVQANSTTTLVVITQLQPITVVFTIPEDYIEEVVSHMTGSSPLELEAFDRDSSKKLDTGKLLTLNNQVDTTTGTVKARAVFPNKDNVLFPNQFVNTNLLVYTLKNVTVVPDAAIQNNEQVAFVYVIEGGTAHMQDVTPGQSDNGMTQVKGIKPGAVVATSGFERLTDKAKVTVVQGGGAGGSTTQPATQPTSQPDHSGHHRHGTPATQPSEESAP